MYTLLGQAPITEYHRLGVLYSRHLFSHSSGHWKSEMRALAWSHSSEDSLTGLWNSAFSLVLT